MSKGLGRVQREVLISLRLYRDNGDDGWDTLKSLAAFAPGLAGEDAPSRYIRTLDPSGAVSRPRLEAVRRACYSLHESGMVELGEATVGGRRQLCARLIREPNDLLGMRQQMEHEMGLPITRGWELPAAPSGSDMASRLGLSPAEWDALVALAADATGPSNSD
jgi:hypothetical protein